MNKIVIVSQKTRLQELLSDLIQRNRLSFILNIWGIPLMIIWMRTVVTQNPDLCQEKAEQYARVSVIDKKLFMQLYFGRDDLVVCVGRDGLVCNTMKYLEESNLVIGINPDPSDGKA